MSFIRKGTLVIVCVFLFILLLVGNSLLILGLSLQYGHLQKELLPVVKEVAVDSLNITDKLEKDFSSVMKIYCQNNSEFVFDTEGYTFVIPCSVIENGTDAVVDYGIESLAKEIYYKKYDCGFWDCQKDKSQPPLFLISEKAQKYWMGKFYISLIVLVILLALGYFLIENKINLAIIAGSLLTVASLPFLAISKILSSFVSQDYLKFLTAFFSSAHSVFLFSLIFGLVILGVGIGLRIWKSRKPVSKKVKKKK